MHAYVDESVHEVRGLYLAAAALVDPADEDRARADLRALRPAGARRLHWQANSAALRHQSVGLAVTYIRQLRVYLAFFDHKRRQEEARGRCLTGLLLDHGGPPVTELVLDRRSPAQDTRDGAHLMAQSVRFGLPHPPKIRHEGSDDEPLLWLADTGAGAVAESLVHGDVSYVRALGSRLVVR